MRKKAPFNKKVFAILLEKARGGRTTAQFAADAGVSYVQLHKLETLGQENAPGKAFLTKIAEAGENGIELEDFLLVCGRAVAAEKPKKPAKKALDMQKLFESLTKGQQKTVYEFMDYLRNYKK